MIRFWTGALGSTAMGNLFDRLKSKHASQAPSGPELPAAVQPHPVLAANGIRNLVTAADLRPAGLRQLMHSIVGRDIGEPGMMSQTLLEQSYHFCDDDGEMYEAFSRDGDWIVHCSGAPGPSAEDIPAGMGRIRTTWYTAIKDDLSPIQTLLTDIMTTYLETPADLRWISRQFDWGFPIVRYHWTSNLGPLHLHEFITQEAREYVVQVPDLLIILHFRPEADDLTLKLIDRPAALPF